MATTYYVDYVNGNAANDGLSWATAKKKLSDISSLSGVEAVKVAKSPDPVSIGLVTWTDNSEQLTLASALTKEVDNCEDATSWTPETNVSVYDNYSYYKQGTKSLQVAVSSATGKLCYKTFSTPQDFSAYTKLTFWIRTTSTVNPNILKVCLCSDSLGDTIVDEFIIDVPLYYNRWYPITLPRNGGGNLGASIQSVAIYAIASPGYPNIYFDNIQAANDLTLTSLIGKNTTSEPYWFSIRSIDGTTVVLASGQASGGIVSRYGGVSETVESFAREPTPTKDDIASSGSTYVQKLNSNGSSPYTVISGGWDPNTDVQDGLTLFDGLNSYGYGLYHHVDNISLRNIGFVRYYRNLDFSSYNGSEFIDIHLIGGEYGDYNLNVRWSTANGIYATCNHYDGIVVTFQNQAYVWQNLVAIGNGNNGLYVVSGSKGGTIENVKCLSNQNNLSCYGMDVIFKNLELRNAGYANLYAYYCHRIKMDTVLADGGSVGVYMSQADFSMYNGTFKNHSSYDIFLSPLSQVWLFDSELLSTTQVYMNSEGNGYIVQFNKGKIVGVYEKTSYSYVIRSNDTEYRTYSPCVEIEPNYWTDWYPAQQSFKAPVDSGVARTLKIYIKKTSDFDGTVQLGVRWKDMLWLKPLSDITGLSTTYQQFTQELLASEVTEDGVVELVVSVKGTAGKIYVDDFEWS